MTKKIERRKVGKPTKITDEVLKEVRKAFLWGASVTEAAAFADIGARTLYDYLEKNPEYSQQVKAWQLNPLLKAKKTVVESLDDAKNAQWYLERKQKDEFSTKVENDVRVKELPKPILGGISKTEVIEVKDDDV